MLRMVAVLMVVAMGALGGSRMAGKLKHRRDALAMAVGLAVKRGRAFLRLVLIPIGLGAGSLAVIVLREGALGWQIGTAWNRLTLQFFVLWLPALAAGMGRSRRGECACPKGLLEQE